MFDILHQYLIQHKSLSLPGLGTLRLQNIPAMSNLSDHTIEPPMQKTIFDDMNDAPDKDLFQYVAARLQLEEWEAIKKVNDFSYELKNQLNHGDEVVWEKVGILHGELNGNIKLDAKTITYDFMVPAPARRIIRTNANHTIIRGDKKVSESFIHHQQEAINKVYAFNEASPSAKRWWLWACAFAGTALLLLFLHFSKNGVTLNALHNTQKNVVKEAPNTYGQPQ